MSYLEDLPETVVEDVPPKRLRLFGIWTATLLGLAILIAAAWFVPLMPMDRDELTVSFSRGEAVIVSEDGSRTELVDGVGVRKGDRIEAEDGAALTLVAADGHRMTITDAASVEVQGSRGTLFRNDVNTRFDVHQGNVRVSGEGEPRTSMEIGLPNGVAGVRGTVFDVKVTELQAAISVHEGAVGLDDTAGDAVELEPGQGAVLSAGGKMVKELPSAPEVRLETNDVIREAGKRIKWQAVDGAAEYMVEIAADEEFLSILAHVESTEPETEIPILDADPPLYARVYAVSSEGLTGAASDPEILRISHHWHEGLGLQMQGDHEGAIAELETAQERFPDEPRLMRDIGWILHLDQKWDEALPVYQEAHALDPDDISIAFELGRVYYWLDDYEQAEAMFKSILIDHPEDAHALWGLGDTYRSLGKTREARKLVRQALEIQPDHPYAKETLAQLR